MKEADFLKAVINAADYCIYLNIRTRKQSKNHLENRAKKLKAFEFCQCQNCEEGSMMAHSTKKTGLVSISKKAFEKELKNEVGLFILVYAMMHEELHVLHPYASEKTIEYKTNRYFKRGLHSMATEGLQHFKEKLGQF